jgi:hypothetical protein
VHTECEGKLPSVEKVCSRSVGVYIDYPVIADQRMLGTFQGEGDASRLTSLGKTLRAVFPRVTNQGGVGELRKGARSTDFCGRENISVLCTTPMPDWISSIVWPGKAPQVVTQMAKPVPAQ